MNKSQAYLHMQNQLPQNASGSGLAPFKVEKSTTYLHFSGYDPRAVGGRQTLKLELRAALDPSIREISFEFCSELLTTRTLRQTLQRTPSGVWQAVLLSFSSKAKEHGQYPLDVQLTYLDAMGCQHLWVCTTTILIPRANASLSEIHQVFLASQKNVRVHAEDGAIAKLGGLAASQDQQHRQLNIDIYAKDAAIAQWDAMTPHQDVSAPLEMGLSSIAWDENLIEVALPTYQIAHAANPTSRLRPPHTQLNAHSKVAASACHRAYLQPRFATGASDAAQVCLPIRLLALPEWTLGRANAANLADIPLAHPHAERRISARHAKIRRTLRGVEIIDTSRYGLVLNNVVLEKHQPMPLLPGMVMEVSANFRGLVQLKLLSLMPHALILARCEQQKILELYYLLTPELRPEAGLTAPQFGDLQIPLLFHWDRQFHQHDVVTMEDRRLAVMSEDDVDQNIFPYHFIADSPGKDESAYRALNSGES